MRYGVGIVLAMTVLATAIACAPTLETETGLVVSIDSSSIGRVDGFDMRTSDGRTSDGRTSDGRTLHFDTSQLEFRPEFPVAHVGEHQRLAETVRVTYRLDGEGLVAVQLADE